MRMTVIDPRTHEEAVGWKCDICKRVFVYTANADEADRRAREEYEALTGRPFDENDVDQVCTECYTVFNKVSAMMQEPEKKM